MEPVPNRILTQAETRRLVALVPLPSRRTTLAHASALPGPAAPVTTALVDTAAAWKVPMSLAASLAWAQSHPPAGLPLSGTSSTGTSGTVTSSALSYTAPDSRSWVAAEVAVTLSPAGPSTTSWRIDGMAEWLDPKPEADSYTGSRIHATVASGCPKSDWRVVGVTDSGQDLTQSLLPRALPTGALICSYQGLNGHPFALRVHRVIATAPARALAATVRGLSLAHVDGLESACANDDESATVFAFAYPGRTADLWYQPGGCPSVANGAIAISSPGGSIGPLIDAARRLLR